jgi:hypothetical protein
MDFTPVAIKENDFWMREAMRRYGGSFVRALAEAFERADYQNYMILREAFPKYVAEYTKDGELMRTPRSEPPE